MKTLLTSSRYTKFIGERDRALERIHQNAQLDLSRITYTMIEQIDRLASSLALRAHGSFLGTRISDQFEQGTKEIMTQAFPLFVQRMRRLRQDSFLLAYAGEQEAIGRATQIRKDVTRSQFYDRLRKQLEAPTLLGPLDRRVWLALMNLRRRILQAFETAASQELPAHEIVAKVLGAFPQAQTYKRPPRALTRVRESAGDSDDPRSWFDFDFIDDGDWDLMTQAYKDTVLPPNRFDDSFPAPEDAAGGYNWLSKYNWEIEQETTEDFVRSVRSGQVEGAQDLGVQEFVWIAIIDKNTCDDCCLPRNGKTTSEIEQLKDDDCDAIVPPAHFNCRCTVGPVASTNEVQGPDWASFNDWLEGPEQQSTR